MIFLKLFLQYNEIVFLKHAFSKSHNNLEFNFRTSKLYYVTMSLKSGKRKLLVEGRRGVGRDTTSKDAGRRERSTEKGGERGRSVERGGGPSAESARPSVFSRLGTKIQGQGAATQQPARNSGSQSYPSWFLR